MSESSEPVLRADGGSTGFRLEAFLGDSFPVEPESLIGQFLELDGPLGLVRGTVATVEPYVDAMLGPGHWVVLEHQRPAAPRPEGRL